MKGHQVIDRTDAPLAPVNPVCGSEREHGGPNSDPYSVWSFNFFERRVPLQMKKVMIAFLLILQLFVSPFFVSFTIESETTSHM